ncbi:MAG: glycosyltransferase [Deltaproteobacteria bacterium]|nr:glycosyltransferase [Deltaproteobacteria bacterium]
MSAPVVAFDICGMSDMIEHQINGYLAKLFDTSDLAAGINWVLSDENRHKELCVKAREREKAVACFDIETIARQYAELYGEVLGWENGS